MFDIYSNPAHRSVGESPDRRAIHGDAIVLQNNWTELIKPNKLDIHPGSDPSRFARVVVEPLERGFGITLGNALRRILLSSLRGAAVTSIHVDGVLHEFSSIPGVREDVACVGAAAYTIQQGSFGVLIYKMGVAFDAVGMYFLFRCLISNFDDLRRLANAAAGRCAVRMPLLHWGGDTGRRYGSRSARSHVAGL